MNPGRRVLLAGLAGLPAALQPVRPALAGRKAAVEVLVGARPGSPPDLWARSVAPFLERHWPRLAVGVRNSPGRLGLDALAQLAAAPPDGRLVGVVTTPALIARAIEAGEPPPFERVEMLAAVAEEPILLVAPAGAGATDLATLQHLGPRGLLGTPPPGTAAQLAALRVEERLGLSQIAFPSPSAVRQAVLGGNVAAAMLNMSDAIGGLRDGRLLAVAVAAAARSPQLPDVPTFREQGVELLAASHRGFALPRAVAGPMRAALIAGLRRAVEDPEFVTQAASLGYAPRFLGPEDWEVILRRSDAALRHRWQVEPWLPGPR